MGVWPCRSAVPWARQPASSTYASGHVDGLHLALGGGVVAAQLCEVRACEVLACHGSLRCAAGPEAAADLEQRECTRSARTAVGARGATLVDGDVLGHDARPAMAGKGGSARGRWQRGGGGAWWGVWGKCTTPTPWGSVRHPPRHGSTAGKAHMAHIPLLGEDGRAHSKRGGGGGGQQGGNDLHGG